MQELAGQNAELRTRLKQKIPLPVKRSIRRPGRALRKLVGLVALRLPVKRVTAARLLRKKQSDVLLWVDPSRIRLVVHRQRPPNLGRGFLIRGGSDWESSSVQTLTDTPTAETMRQLLVEGRPPEDTLQYQSMMRAVREWEEAGGKGKPVGAYWCRSEADVDRYFEILLTACADIRDNGYQTQAELHQLRPNDNRHLRDEIQVTIGSDGTPYLQRGGTHRTLIAQHHQIARVPVRVVSVDEGWAVQHLQPRSGSLASALQAAIDGDERTTSSHPEGQLP